MWAFALAFALAQDSGDPVRGRILAGLAGCRSCHTADDGPDFAGGHAIETPYGTWYGTNLTPDPVAGIGAWDLDDFRRALWRGRSPDGHPYFPSFPYTSFTGMTEVDLIDLWAFLGQVPPADRPNRAHEVEGRYGSRFLVRFWKLLYFRPGRWRPDREASDAVDRGSYLGTAVGHCDGCHAPRNGMGAVRGHAGMSGNTEPPSSAPNITPHDDGLGDWDTDELADFFVDGMTPEGDFAGGHMHAIIVDGTALLPESDRRALAEWVMAQDPKPSPGARTEDVAEEDEDW